jgi:hypothetical protein
MAQSGAIWTEKQTYGVGEVEYNGAFAYTTGNNANAVIIHGKGFTVTRSNTGCYQVGLNTSFLAMISGQAAISANATTNTVFSHPGFAQCGDLANNNTFYIYTYNSTAVQLDPTANTVYVEFSVTLSNSNTNK